jgi:hypothetical protein
MDLRAGVKYRLVQRTRTVLAHGPRHQHGKKLYAVRVKTGKFKDIQSYQRVHAADLRSMSKAAKAVVTKKS